MWASIMTLSIIMLRIKTHWSIMLIRFFYYKWLFTQKYFPTFLLENNVSGSIQSCTDLGSLDTTRAARLDPISGCISPWSKETTAKIEWQIKLHLPKRCGSRVLTEGCNFSRKTFSWVPLYCDISVTCWIDEKSVRPAEKNNTIEILEYNLNIHLNKISDYPFSSCHKYFQIAIGGGRSKYLQFSCLC